MEIAKEEFAALAQIVGKVEELTELDELQLTLVGGGVGDVILV